jgi:hypothetical protein
VRNKTLDKELAQDRHQQRKIRIGTACYYAANLNAINPYVHLPFCL